MNNIPSIEARGVNKTFKKHRVLSDIDLTIARGEIFGLLGPSGCGKTTTVKILAGILSRDSGTVKVLGTDMPDLDIMSKVGYMTQAAALYKTLTGMENLKFFGSMYKLSGEELTRRIEHAAGIVGMTEELSRPVSGYSGGMMQRLSLAIALLPDPEVLILDEPTVGIDPMLRADIWKELRGLADNGTTVLITTHVMDEAIKCGRLAMMRDGHMIATGTPEELTAAAGKDTLEEAFIYYGGDGHEN